MLLLLFTNQAGSPVPVAEMPQQACVHIVVIFANPTR